MFSEKRRSRRLPIVSMLIVSLFGTAVATLPADAAGWPIKPDFCYVVNPGSSDVEITFFPSKLNITQGDGADNAVFYRIARSDGQSWDVPRTAAKNLHDYGAAGADYRYEVYSVGHNNIQVSQRTDCVALRSESSIAPGRLKDWRRTASVIHGLGEGSVGSSTRYFTGADDDVVTTEVSAEESDALNPHGGQFSFQAKVTLTTANLQALTTATGPSWNVMQRGYADSQGGQWKMSLVTDNTGMPRAQCAMRDGDGNAKTANSTYELAANTKMTITCVIDDDANTIRVIVNGRTDSAAPAPAGFGTVAPYHSGTSCWQRIARTISIGNKPLCGTGTLTDDDRFQGTIHNARTLKG